MEVNFMILESAHLERYAYRYRPKLFNAISSVTCLYVYVDKRATCY